MENINKIRPINIIVFSELFKIICFITIIILGDFLKYGNSIFVSFGQFFFGVLFDLYIIPFVSTSIGALVAYYFYFKTVKAKRFFRLIKFSLVLFFMDTLVYIFMAIIGILFL